MVVGGTPPVRVGRCQAPQRLVYMTSLFFVGTFSFHQHYKGYFSGFIDYDYYLIGNVLHNVDEGQKLTKTNRKCLS
jgi:hypothetical protein